MLLLPSGEFYVHFIAIMLSSVAYGEQTNENPPGHVVALLFKKVCDGKGIHLRNQKMVEGGGSIPI